MKKKIIIMLVILAAIIGIYFARDENEPFIIVNQGENTERIQGEFISNHPEAISFPAVVRSSGNKPVETEYKGVELSKFLSSLDYDTSNIDKITLNAEDGYRIIIDSEELNEPKNLYLTFERDGKRLKSKKRNGNGPFQLVIRRDPFSQRWIKHVDEIIIE